MTSCESAIDDEGVGSFEGDSCCCLTRGVGEAVAAEEAALELTMAPTADTNEPVVLAKPGDDNDDGNDEDDGNVEEDGGDDDS